MNATGELFVMAVSRSGMWEAALQVSSQCGILPNLLPMIRQLCYGNNAVCGYKLPISGCFFSVNKVSLKSQIFNKKKYSDVLPKLKERL